MPAWHMVRAIQKKKEKERKRKTSSVLIILTQAGVVSLGM